MGIQRSIGAMVVLLTIFTIRFLPSFLDGKELTYFFFFTRDNSTDSSHGSGILKRESSGDSLAVAESGTHDRTVEEKSSSSLFNDQKPPDPSHASSPSILGTGHSGSVRPDGKKVPAEFINHPLRFLSEAPLDSLVMLPGIGPVLAERIATARSGKGPFISWEAVRQVKGLGPKKVARLKQTSGKQK